MCDNNEIVRMLERLIELQCFKGDRMPIKDNWVNSIFNDAKEMVNKLKAVN